MWIIGKKALALVATICVGRHIIVTTNAGANRASGRSRLPAGRPTAIIELRDNTPSRAARLAIERHGDLVEALLVERERAARPSQP